jgi:hypothetical protein
MSDNLFIESKHNENTIVYNINTSFLLKDLEIENKLIPLSYIKTMTISIHNELLINGYLYKLEKIYEDEKNNKSSAIYSYGDSKLNISLGCIQHEEEFNEKEQKYKTDWMNRYAKMKSIGIDPVKMRINQIQIELSRVNNIKEYILFNKLYLNLNIKDKHISTKGYIKPGVFNKNKDDIYGFFTISYKDDDVKSLLNRYNIEYLTIDTNETDKNRNMKINLLRFLLSRILNQIDLYLSYLYKSIENLETHPFLLSNIYAMNHIIPDNVINIDEKNKHLIILNDNFSEIYVFRSYHTPGIVRMDKNIYIATCYILCKSKLEGDIKKKNKGSWNIFPGCITNTNKIEIFNDHDVTEFLTRTE